MNYGINNYEIYDMGEKLLSEIGTELNEIGSVFIKIGIFSYIALAISILCTVYMVWALYKIKKTQEAINRQNETLLKQIVKIESRLEAIQYKREATDTKPH